MDCLRKEEKAPPVPSFWQSAHHPHHIPLISAHTATLEARKHKAPGLSQAFFQSSARNSGNSFLALFSALDRAPG